jgi:DNA-directed RNA polymerase subunit RPC12/RpoP
MNNQMLSPPKPEIDAICKECGQKYAEVQYASMPWPDGSVDTDPYCPECHSRDLEFPRPRD